MPLTTKGEFYETHTSLKSRLCFPGMLDKTGPLALDKDCLYKISHLLRRVPLPVKVKLLHGSLPDGIPKDFTGNWHNFEISIIKVIALISINYQTEQLIESLSSRCFNSFHFQIPSF